ncbi:hypothetical protein ACHAQA_005257 [Verticillium albo-atrum]
MELDEDAKPSLAVLDLEVMTSGGFGDGFSGERNHSIDGSLKHVRGQPDDDRDYRHPRMRAEKASKRDFNKARREVLDAPVAPLSVVPAGHPKQTDEWDLLPPLPEIVEAVHLFTRKYFQLGFIPKQMFPARLQRDHQSVSVFLLLSILSISARFSLALTRRYEGEIKAVDFFMERASALALRELYEEPTLERCQAFYLLSIAQQGSGWRNRSYINLGIATRMAILMHLHREETYTIKAPTPELVIKAESARRTLWMLHSQDNLHCGAKSPISLAASDITCLLPSDENDFACGHEPDSRAALEDTPPARDNPGLIHQPTRSLFASLIQAHYYWGKVARRAMVSTKSSSPWDAASDYSKMADSLTSWEQQLPPDHKWSPVLLKGHKSVGEDLAYMSVTMVTKLCNVVLRRPYLDDIIHPGPKSQAHRAFFTHLSDELFRNVRDLFEQIDIQFSVRDPDESVGAQMASFCVYSCGLFSTYLCKYKNICSDRTIVKQGRTMLLRCMSLLMESKEVWPLASRWLESLERFSRDPKAATVSLDGGMADGNDRTLRPLQSGYSPSLTGVPSSQGKSIIPCSPLPGPMSPNEDSKPKGLLLPANTTPNLAQATHYPPHIKTSAEQQQRPLPGQTHHAHHSILPQPSPRQSRRQSTDQTHMPAPSQQHQQQQQHALPQPQLSPASPFLMQQQQQQQHTPYQHQQYQHQQTPFATAGLPQTGQTYAGFAQHQSPFSQHTPMGVLVQAAFDQPQDEQQQQEQQRQISQQAAIAQFPQPQPHSLSSQASFDGTTPMQPQLFTPPTPTALGPGNDGYEGELQSWFDESAQTGNWVGNGAGMGMGYY